MSQIFDGLDFNPSFKTDNEYAKNYNNWRNKEELNKFKTKYGEDIDQEESSSSSEDEDGIELSENLEKDFFKTLACLKNKDPRIYDENVQFFSENIEESRKSSRKKKDEVVTIKDYERKLILEKGGVLSDEEDEYEENRPRSPTYVEEQKQLKENLKKVLDDVDEDNEDNEWGGIFQQRQKTKEEKDKEEADYKKWLTGQKKNLDDKTVESELKPLKDYWNKPDLDEEEKFLRDYILKKKFLDDDEDDHVPTYDEIVHDSDQDLSNDEENIEKQEEFEHKFNFRFEEPDQEFIKQFPRTVENSLRRKDDRRKVKRQEVKERKKSEKDEKMRELKKLQELKRKEIEDKLEKLKEITGNESLGFNGEDIDGDFDPDEHDRKMKALFSDEYYAGEEDEQKPQFPDLDEELEIENWERYNVGNQDASHCEDDDFNMDCDYNPQMSTQEELIENSRGRKKRKRKSKFAEALGKPKPKYDPSDRNYEKYFDDYYKLDCEDIVADIPCRFKYRKVAPNDFGLTTEEILLANERELNKWCSLKKAVQIRPDHVEKFEQVAYKKKGQNVNLKRKILPSLFSKEPDDGAPQGSSSNVVTDQSTNDRNVQKKELENQQGESKNEKKITTLAKKILSNDSDELRSEEVADHSSTKEAIQDKVQKSETVNKKKKKKKKKPKTNLVKKDTPSLVSDIPNKENLNSEEVTDQPKTNKTMKKEEEEAKRQTPASLNKKKRKKKAPKLMKGEEKTSQISAKDKKKLKIERKLGVTKEGSLKDTKMPGKIKQLKRKRKNSDNDGAIKKGSKRVKISKQGDGNNLLGLSDARLSAYGINPKKFKNKLKYKK
ncbi:unnamed protein product, partial [Phaedon cochleariae]